MSELALLFQTYNLEVLNQDILVLLQMQNYKAQVTNLFLLSILEFLTLCLFLFCIFSIAFTNSILQKLTKD
mgnify:CR=1 FL=1